MTEQATAVIHKTEPAVVATSNALPFKPQFRRDIFPRNHVFSAQDLSDLYKLVADLNEKSKEIEFSNLELGPDDDAVKLKSAVHEVVQVECSIKTSSGDNATAIGGKILDSSDFYDEIQTFFISNSTYANKIRSINIANGIDIFLDFRKPTLKIDLRTLPSNPTENGSVINIYGSDEGWVATAEGRIRSFLDRRQSARPFLHGSGTYDYVLQFVWFPSFLWIYAKYGLLSDSYFHGKSIMFNVVFGIYAFLMVALTARFFFQYFRWLFPPMEYYKSKRTGAYIHRGIIIFLLSGFIVNAGYDFVKFLIGRLMD